VVSADLCFRELYAGRRPPATLGRCSGLHLATCFRYLDAELAVILDVLRAASHTNSWTCSSRRPRALFSQVGAPSSRRRRSCPQLSPPSLPASCPQRTGSRSDLPLAAEQNHPLVGSAARPAVPRVPCRVNSCRNKIQFRLLMSPFSGQIRIELMSAT
jgi:hypothetical protein